MCPDGYTYNGLGSCIGAYDDGAGTCPDGWKVRTIGTKKSCVLDPAKKDFKCGDGYTTSTSGAGAGCKPACGSGYFFDIVAESCLPTGKGGKDDLAAKCALNNNADGCKAFIDSCNSAPADKEPPAGCPTFKTKTQLALADSCSEVADNTTGTLGDKCKQFETDCQAKPYAPGCKALFTGEARNLGEACALGTAPKASCDAYNKCDGSSGNGSECIAFNNQKAKTAGGVCAVDPGSSVCKDSGLVDKCSKPDGAKTPECASFSQGKGDACGKNQDLPDCKKFSNCKKGDPGCDEFKFSQAETLGATCAAGAPTDTAKCGKFVKDHNCNDEKKADRECVGFNDKQQEIFGENCAKNPNGGGCKSSLDACNADPDRKGCAALVKGQNQSLGETCATNGDTKKCTDMAEKCKDPGAPGCKDFLSGKTDGLAKACGSGNASGAACDALATKCDSAAGKPGGAGCDVLDQSRGQADAALCTKNPDNEKCKDYKKCEKESSSPECVGFNGQKGSIAGQNCVANPSDPSCKDFAGCTTDNTSPKCKNFNESAGAAKGAACANSLATDGACGDMKKKCDGSSSPECSGFNNAQAKDLGEACATNPTSSACKKMDDKCGSPPGGGSGSGAAGCDGYLEAKAKAIGDACDGDPNKKMCTEITDKCTTNPSAKGCDSFEAGKSTALGARCGSVTPDSPDCASQEKKCTDGTALGCSDFAAAKGKSLAGACQTGDKSDACTAAQAKACGDGATPGSCESFNGQAKNNQGTYCATHPEDKSCQDAGLTAEACKAKPTADGCSSLNDARGADCAKNNSTECANLRAECKDNPGGASCPALEEAKKSDLVAKCTADGAKMDSGDCKDLKAACDANPGADSCKDVNDKVLSDLGAKCGKDPTSSPDCDKLASDCKSNPASNAGCDDLQAALCAKNPKAEGCDPNAPAVAATDDKCTKVPPEPGCPNATAATEDKCTKVPPDPSCSNALKADASECNPPPGTPKNPNCVNATENDGFIAARKAAFDKVDNKADCDKLNGTFDGSTSTCTDTFGDTANRLYSERAQAYAQCMSMPGSTAADCKQDKIKFGDVKAAMEADKKKQNQAMIDGAKRPCDDATPGRRADGLPCGGDVKGAEYQGCKLQGISDKCKGIYYALVVDKYGNRAGMTRDELCSIANRPETKKEVEFNGCNDDQSNVEQIGLQSQVLDVTAQVSSGVVAGMAQGKMQQLQAGTPEQQANLHKQALLEMANAQRNVGYMQMTMTGLHGVNTLMAGLAARRQAKNQELAETLGSNNVSVDTQILKQDQAGQVAMVSDGANGQKADTIKANKVSQAMGAMMAGERGTLGRMEADANGELSKSAEFAEKIKKQATQQAVQSGLKMAVAAMSAAQNMAAADLLEKQANLDLGATGSSGDTIHAFLPGNPNNQVPDSAGPPQIGGANNQAAQSAVSADGPSGDAGPGGAALPPPLFGGGGNPGGLKDTPPPATGGLLGNGTTSGGGGGGGGVGGGAGGGDGGDKDKAGGDLAGDKVKFDSAGAGGGSAFAGAAGGGGKRSQDTGMDLNGLLGQFMAKPGEDRAPAGSILDFNGKNKEGTVGPGDKDDGSILGKNANLFIRVSNTTMTYYKKGNLR